MDYLHWQSLLAKPPATATRDSHVTMLSLLALVILGGVTKNQNVPICVALHKMAKAS
jgi:hypothetical protein